MTDYIDLDDTKKDMEKNGNILSFLSDKRFNKIISTIDENISNMLKNEEKEENK
jgi:hypothetical protein